MVYANIPPGFVHLMTVIVCGRILVCIGRICMDRVIVGMLPGMWGTSTSGCVILLLSRNSSTALIQLRQSL